MRITQGSITEDRAAASPVQLNNTGGECQTAAVMLEGATDVKIHMLVSRRILILEISEKMANFFRKL